MQINERIKNIRKALDLNQSDFAKKLGIGQAAISALEKGIRNITDQTILLLCSTYNVNEDYLRNGTLPMFNQNETFSLDEYAREHNASDIDIEILKIYLNLDKDVRKKIISDFKKIFMKENNELAITKESKPQEKETDEIPLGKMIEEANKWETLIEKKQMSLASQKQNDNLKNAGSA